MAPARALVRGVGPRGEARHSRVGKRVNASRLSRAPRARLRRGWSLWECVLLRARRRCVWFFSGRGEQGWRRKGPLRLLLFDLCSSTGKERANPNAAASLPMMTRHRSTPSGVLDGCCPDSRTSMLTEDQNVVHCRRRWAVSSIRLCDRRWLRRGRKPRLHAAIGLPLWLDVALTPHS